MKSLSALLIPLSLSVVLSSCTLNEGDPQTTLCQKLTEHLMTAKNKDVQWGEANKVIGKDDLKVTVSFNNTDGSTTQATCSYGPNDLDQGEDYEFNPDSFLAYPDSMVINGQSVRAQDLNTALHKVTGQSIRDTANEEHLRKKAGEAADAVKDGAAKARDAAGNAAQNIKEGSEVLRQKTGEILEKAGEKLQK